MRYSWVIFLAVFASLFIGEAAGDVIFVEKNNFPYQLEKVATDISANDYYCDYDFDSIMVSTPERIYFIMQDGKIKGGYIFYQPDDFNVKSIEFFVSEPAGLASGRGGCRGVAGALNGKIYYFLNRQDSLYDISSFGIWSQEITDWQINTVSKLDSDGDGNNDVILFGTGGFGGTRAGTVYNITLNGDTYIKNSSIISVEDKISNLITVDLRGDGIEDEIVFSYSNKLKVIKSNGTEIWELTFDSNISDFLSADIDRDGGRDDILVGSSYNLTAVNSDKSILWGTNFSEKISSMSKVDIDHDGLIDYYVIAAGRNLYGIDYSGGLLFTFETPVTIQKHISLDFDGDEIFDDIAFISGDKVYAYDYSERDVPVLGLKLKASPENLTLDESSIITFSATNIGEATALNSDVICRVPESLTVGEGEKSFYGSITKGLSKELNFDITGSASGNHTIDCTVVFYDSFGKSYSASISKTIQVMEKDDAVPPEENGGETPPEEPTGTPLLVIQRSFSNSVGLLEENLSIGVGENMSVDIMIRNQGDGSAVNVLVVEALPEGFELEDGSITFSGEIQPGRLEIITYSVRAMDIPNESYIYPVVNVTYQDSTGNQYESSIESVEFLKVKSALFSGIFLIGGIFLVLIILIIAVTIILKKTGKLPKKLDALLNKIKIPGAFSKIGDMLPKKGEKKLSEKEQAFLKLYGKYQKQGKRPSYGEVSEELGIEIDEVEKIVKKLKKKIKKTK